jgi:predicted HicB family RNase H-like nuclease
MNSLEGEVVGKTKTKQRSINKINRKLSSAQVTKNVIEQQQQQDAVVADGDPNDPDDPIKRLRELEDMIVGGEQANNEELKKRRNKKKKYAEERKALLAEALRNGDDEEFMLRVYDSVQEEVKFKSKLLEKEAEKVNFLGNEVKDLQREFEQEREEYLDTIRKLERQNKLLSKLLQKIQPLISHECNYYNLDRMQSLATWSEELQDWIIPELKREKLSLPSMSNGNQDSESVPLNVRKQQQQQQQPLYEANTQLVEERDRYRMKLENSNYNESVGYFKTKRQAELLNQTSDVRQNNGTGRLSPLRNASLYDRNLRSKK